VLTVLLLLLIGVAARRAGVLPDGAARVLDAVVVRLSLPALILAVVPGIPLDATVLVPVAVAWGTLGVLAVAVLVLARLLRLDPVTRATLLIVVPLGNTSFLGFPAVEALLGAEQLGFAVVYDQLGSFLGLATYAAILAARYGTVEEGTARPNPFRRVLTFPPFLALVLALLLRPIGVPPPLLDLAEVLGATVTPLAMLAIGLRLDLAVAGHKPLALGLGLGLRMVLAPALVLAAVVATGASGAVYDVALLESAMPPMVTAAVVASDAGLDDRLAAGLAGLGVLVAMVTLPAWTLVLGAVG
jgi:malate permease and related proteins